jgi:zinc protease
MRLPIVFALVGLITTVGPVSAQPPSAARPQQRASSTGAALTVPFTQFTLPNGLHVILHEDHTVPLATVNVWYHVGSAREKPGRTGFAHLFEHLMFEGSAHVKEGAFDTLLETAGGTNNGSTETDRTNYYIDVPSNALELALFLESDRMGYLLETMTPERVNGQRDVVKNERRQSYENAPYGMAQIEIDKMLYPESHPYRWPTIGYMEDLTAASHQDVVDFFKQYYQPGNASLVIAGDIDPKRTRALVEKWFSDVKPGSGPVPPIDFPHPMLTAEKTATIQDRVQLPRLYLSWLTPPHFNPGDAELDVVAQILAGGKNSRLYKRLVYDLQIALDVSAFQASAKLGSQFQIIVTAKPPEKDASAKQSIDRIRSIVDEEIARLPGAAQSQIRIGWIGVPRSTPDYFALRVLNTVLGGAFTSRLNMNLREEHGYAYGASSTFDMRASAGPFFAAAGVQTDKTAEAISEFFKELEGIRKPIPPEELDKAKSYLALQLPRNFETTGSLSAALSPVFVYGLPDNYFATYMTRVRAVTQADTERATERYIHPDKFAVVFVGDRKTIEPGIKALNLGPIKVVTIEDVMK